MSTWLFGAPKKNDTTTTTQSTDDPFNTNITFNWNDLLALDPNANKTGFENYTFPEGVTPPLYYSIYNKTDANIRDYNVEYFDQYYVIPLLACISLGILYAIVFKWFRKEAPPGFTKRELGKGCAEISWNILMFLLEIVLAVLEIYFLVVNTLKARSRFLGTQYIIYKDALSPNTSYIIKDEFMIFNNASATQFFKDFPEIGFSSMQSFMNVRFNSSSSLNITNCHPFTDTEVQFTKDIYLFKDFYYILLFVAITSKTVNAYWGWLGFRFEFSDKWKGVIIAFMVNAFSASELGFSFFESDTDCLIKVDFFEFIYYFMFIFLGGFIVMILAIVMRLCVKSEKDIKCVECTFKVGVVLFLLSGTAVFILFTIILIKSNDDLEKGSGIAGLAMLALSILINVFSSDADEEEKPEGEAIELVEKDTHSNKGSEKQDKEDLEKNNYQEIEMGQRQPNDVYVFGTERP